MCEMMGTEPVEGEEPVEIEDLPQEAQLAFDMYVNLRDRWDYFNGIYEGKDFSIIRDIFDLWEIPKQEQRTYFSLLTLIDNVRSEEIRKKQELNKKPGN